MANLAYTPELGAEYQEMYLSAEIDPDWKVRVEDTVRRITQNRQRYEFVAASLGSIPWYFIGIIHNMEGSLNFKTHLHNGDPLTAKTRNVPSGRPLNGNPPYKWEESAIDALTMKNFQRETDWTIPKMLYRFEKYNGFGYRLYHPDVYSPYLWSATDWYDCGKYASDGKFDPNLVSKQVGAVAIMKCMEAQGIVQPLKTTKFE